MLNKQAVLRGIAGLIIMCSVLGSMGFVLLLESKSMIFSYAVKQIEEIDRPEPFPVSVDPIAKTIIEDPAADTFFTDALAAAPDSRRNWWNKVAAFFAEDDWYQNLASPVGRIVVIWPGERKEEAAKKIGEILRWDVDDRLEFQRLVDETAPTFSDGKYYPGQYIAHRGATPADMQQLISSSFEKEILARYTPEVAEQVPLEDALIIASLLEREASDFENMREISGVIWNRLFINMPLQLDATLQYARGSRAYEPAWWPAVRPADKYMDSPYNTYKNEGLPPGPISNPSAEAILAALNPIPTDCLFYFHTSNGTYHCSADYQEHVSKLRSIYGRGR
ncbi:MAG: endolytic transglycosylase MltG [Candidatus Kaiserbacteria bacterium]|nr:endolytic transglycosylase MltG [Candidatus Kaiserbacteria bacterium]MCB9815861.1 endolytic transglycosylase MltG [Candidatus Nomurabacteria bacterium]